MPLAASFKFGFKEKFLYRFSVDSFMFYANKNISRRLHPITPSYAAGVKNTDIVPLVKQISENIKEGKALQEKFTKLAKNEANCSFTHFFKAKYVSVLDLRDDIYSYHEIIHYGNDICIIDDISGTTWKKLR